MRLSPHQLAKKTMFSMTLAADWRPVFPGKPPTCWLALVATRSGVVTMSDFTLDARKRSWLASWLTAYDPPVPDLEASYVYLRLAASWNLVLQKDA